MPLQPNPNALDHLNDLGVHRPIPRIQVPSQFTPTPPVASQKIHQKQVAPVARAMAPKTHRPAQPAATPPKLAVGWRAIQQAVVRGFFKGVLIAVVLQVMFYVLRLFGILTFFLLVALLVVIPEPACFAGETTTQKLESVADQKDVTRVDVGQANTDEVSSSTDPPTPMDADNTRLAMNDSKTAVGQTPVEHQPDDDSERDTTKPIEQEATSESPRMGDSFEMAIKNKIEELRSEIQHLAERLEHRFEDPDPVAGASSDAHATDSLTGVNWFVAASLVAFMLGYKVGIVRDIDQGPRRRWFTRPFPWPGRRRRPPTAGGESLAFAHPSKAVLHTRNPAFTETTDRPTHSSRIGGDDHHCKPNHPKRPWRSAAQSIAGPVRPENQDVVCLLDVVPGVELVAVADGCGGVPHGARAAQSAVQAAVRSISNSLAAGSIPSEAIIAQGFQAACMALQNEAQKLGFDGQTSNDRFGLNTTLMLLLANETSYFYGYIGDGCITLLRSSDDLIELMEPQRVNNMANMLSACLGPRPKGEAVIRSEVRHAGDLLLLATDGIADRYDPVVLASHLKNRIIEAGGDVDSTVKHFLSEIDEQTDDSGFPLFDDNLSIALVLDGKPISPEITVNSGNLQANGHRRTSD